MRRHKVRAHTTPRPSLTGAETPPADTGPMLTARPPAEHPCLNSSQVSASRCPPSPRSHTRQSGHRGVTPQVHTARREGPRPGPKHLAPACALRHHPVTTRQNPGCPATGNVLTATGEPGRGPARVTAGVFIVTVRQYAREGKSGDQLSSGAVAASAPRMMAGSELTQGCSRVTGEDLPRRNLPAEAVAEPPLSSPWPSGPDGAWEPGCSMLPNPGSLLTPVGPGSQIWASVAPLPGLLLTRIDSALITVTCRHGPEYHPSPAQVSETALGKHVELLGFGELGEPLSGLTVKWGGGHSQLPSSFRGAYPVGGFQE